MNIFSPVRSDCFKFYSLKCIALSFSKSEADIAFD